MYIVVCLILNCIIGWMCSTNLGGEDYWPFCVLAAVIIEVVAYIIYKKE